MAGARTRHEDLYSQTGNQSRRRRLAHFVSAAAFAAFSFSGVSMAQAQVVRRGDPAPAQVTTQDFESVKSELTAAFLATKNKLTDMNKAGMPAAVGANTPEIRALIIAIEHLNDMIKSRNGDATFLIPISGKNDDEKFHSLNTWLSTDWRNRKAMPKRDQDAPIEMATNGKSPVLDEIELRVNSSLAALSVLVGINNKPIFAPVPAPPVVPPPEPTRVVPVPLPQVKAVPPKPAPKAEPKPIQKKDVPPPKIVSKPESKPKPVAALPQVAPPPVAKHVPKEVDPDVIALSDERRRQYTSILESGSLTIIGQWGSPAFVKTTAAKAESALRAILDNKNPTKKDLQYAADQAQAAQKLIGSALASAQKRAAENAPKAAGVTPKAIADSQPQIRRILDDMQKVAADQSRSNPAHQMATRIANSITDIWLVGEREPRRVIVGANSISVVISGSGPRWEMVDCYLAAANALVAKNENVAQTKIAEAQSVFNREQAFAESLIADLKAMGSILVNEKGISSKLPKSNDLRAAGLLQTSRPTRGRATVDNGSESMERELVQRMDAADKYLSTAKGHLSFNYVSDLHQYVSLYSRAVGQLVDIYGYYAQHNDRGKNQFSPAFLTNYATAARIMVDPEFNPWSSYPVELRQILRTDLARASGKAIVSDSEASAALFAVPQWRYDSAIYAVYSPATKFAPEFSSTVKTAAVEDATFRSRRILYTKEYLPYLTGELSDSSHRFEDAKFYLNDAIDLAKKSSLPPIVTTVLIQTGNAWLNAHKNPATKDERIAVANAFTQLAIDIVSICDDETWLANKDLQSEVTDPIRKKAREQTNAARIEFSNSFSVPQVMPFLYPALSRHISDSAFNLLAPPAILATEGQARYAVTIEADSSRKNVLGVIAAAAKTNDKADETKLWNAGVTDRPGAFNAAAAAELDHLRMFVSLGKDKAFGISPLDTLLVRSSRAGSYDMFDPRFARADPAPFSETVRRPTTRDTADQGVAVTGSGSGLRISTTRESAPVQRFGTLLVELNRQSILKNDESVDILLKGLDVAPDDIQIRTTKNGVHAAADSELKKKMIAIAGLYGLPPNQPFLSTLRARMFDSVESTTNPKDSEAKEENVFKSLFAARMAELEVRLSGNRTSDGTPISVLARSNDPKVAYIKRAQAEYDELTRLSRSNSDLLSWRQMILKAENAIESLSDPHMDEIPKPTTPQIKFSIRDLNVPIKYVRGSDGKDWGSATANIMVTYEPGKPTIPLNEYEEKIGKKQNLTYYWAFYTELGRGEKMLLNPNEGFPGQARYVGRVMQNISLPDGSVGDAVVAVNSNNQPVMKAGKYNILYRLQDGKLDPVKEDCTPDTLRLFRSTHGNIASAHKYGDMEAHVIANPE